MATNDNVYRLQLAIITLRTKEREINQARDEYCKAIGAATSTEVAEAVRRADLIMGFTTDASR